MYTIGSRGIGVEIIVSHEQVYILRCHSIQAWYRCFRDALRVLSGSLRCTRKIHYFYVVPGVPERSSGRDCKRLSNFEILKEDCHMSTLTLADCL